MFKTMRLRDKMTLWYTALTLLTVMAFAGTLYLITSSVLENILEKEARLSLKQIIAQIENKNGLLTFENEIPISPGTMYFITEENGSELASYGEDITFFDQVPIKENTLRTIQGENTKWLLLDSDPVHVDQFTLRARVAVSCENNGRVLSILILIFLIGIPLIILIALAGGITIAEKSLYPIRRIIQSARIISAGDLSERIPKAPAKDELGELTDTLNLMLSSVETSFTHEKRFTSDASHELRTPVAVMRAYTESLLSQSDMSEEQRAALQMMLNECTNMQRIIGQLLTITRWQEGCYPICMETVELKGICDGVAETLADRLSEKNIVLNNNVPEGLMLVADQSLLTEMLFNLVENAVKYGKPYGQITISASQKDCVTELLIQDDGIGIPKDALPHIFERFFRVDPARDRSGTGLGLSIVQWIAEAHQGTIRVESDIDIGTSFYIELPENINRAQQSRP